MSDDPMEKPAKKWEVKAVKDRQDAQEKQFETIDLKLDKLIESQITAAHVEDKIKNIDEKFEGKIKAVYEKYDPSLDNMTWLTRAVIVAVLAVIGNIATTIWRG